MDFADEPHPQDIIEHDTITLSGDGDALLLVRDTSKNEQTPFLVSTGVVKSASDVFRRLFDGDFAESRMLSKGLCPRIPLHDDDDDTMAIILRILHHEIEFLPENLDLDQIASLAIHCDKYDCVGVLRPWLLAWLTRLSPVENDPVGVGLLILTTYLLRTPSHFAAATSTACKTLSPNFPEQWISNEKIHMLPDVVEGTKTVVEDDAAHS